MVTMFIALKKNSMVLLCYKFRTRYIQTKAWIWRIESTEGASIKSHQVYDL